MCVCISCDNDIVIIILTTTIAYNTTYWVILLLLIIICYIIEGKEYQEINWNRKKERERIRADPLERFDYFYFYFK